MDRRRFLGGIVILPLLPHISWADGWSEYLPCGQLVQFTSDGEITFGHMRRRGIEYALGSYYIDNLRFSMNATCFKLDRDAGLASEDDWERYHAPEQDRVVY